MEDLNFSCHFQKLPNLTAFPLQTKTPPFSTPAMGSTSFSHIHLQIKSHSKHVIRRSRSKKDIGIRIRKCMSACGSHGRTLCVQATSCVCVCGNIVALCNPCLWAAPGGFIDGQTERVPKIAKLSFCGRIRWETGYHWSGLVCIENGIGGIGLSPCHFRFAHCSRSTGRP